MDVSLSSAPERDELLVETQKQEGKEESWFLGGGWI